MAVSRLNANAELMGRNAALFMNINAAKGLQDVMKTNLGPKGTVKMLVGGAGDLKLTKARRRRGLSSLLGSCDLQQERDRLASSILSGAGRERPPARDADPEPHCRHDC